MASVGQQMQQPERMHRKRHDCDCVPLQRYARNDSEFRTDKIRCCGNVDNVCFGISDDEANYVARAHHARIDRILRIYICRSPQSDGTARS